MAGGYCGGDPQRIARLKVSQAFLFAQTAGRRMSQQMAWQVRAIRMGMAGTKQGHKQVNELLEELEDQ